MFFIRSEGGLVIVQESGLAKGGNLLLSERIEQENASVALPHTSEEV